MPASRVSRHSYSKRARRLSATTPVSTNPLSFLAITVLRSVDQPGMDQRRIDGAARRFRGRHQRQADILAEQPQPRSGIFGALRIGLEEQGAVQGRQPVLNG